MSDVNETLQELMTRRLRDLGSKRGLDGPLPLKQAHDRLPLNVEGKPIVSYETFRQISTGSHGGVITDTTASALAYALEVSENDVFVAAGQRPRLGSFDLPAYASQLDDDERRVVLGVINAILAAGGRGEALEGPTKEGGGTVTSISRPTPPARTTKKKTAARDTGKPTAAQRAAKQKADEDFEPR